MFSFASLFATIRQVGWSRSRVFLVLVDWTLVPKRTEIGLRTLLWLPAAVPGLCNCDKRVAVAEAETRGGIEFALSSICPEFNLP